MPSLSLDFKDAAVMTAEDAVRTLKADTARGLTPAQAAERRAAVGLNEIARQRRGPWRILVRQLSSPFIYLLVIAAVVAYATGEKVDAGMIVLFMVVNTALGFYQEFRAEKAVEVLMKYWKDKAHVLRDGALALLPTGELVPGDVVRLQAGDKMPADVRFVTARGLTVDESILTGESASVGKDVTAAAKPPRDYYEASNIGFSGTSVLTGEADAVVIATGKGTALGDIARLTGETRTTSSFEREIASFSAFILKLVIVTLFFMFALNVALKGVGRIEELVLFSIALTVGVIPEALPIVATIALSRGALRMAKKKVIVKRLSAIDDLGSIDILCTDKTGTITQNVMSVADVQAADEDSCLRYALLASSFLGEAEQRSNNAFDLALWRHVDEAVRDECARSTKVAEIPFDPVRRRNAVLVEEPDGSRVAILRGAPDEVVPRCGAVPDQIALGKYVAMQGLAGNRIIAVGVKTGLGKDATLSEDPGFVFLGIVALHDPLKPDAMKAAKRSQELGVKVKILTGDSKEVAGAVAYKLRLINDPLAVITGAELEAMPNDARHRAVHDFDVFARVNPRQKFLVLQLLQEKSVVGFLGEGFNDAPGLKLANVGLAVEGASDIAREAADVILLNQSLGVIFDGIEEGRRTFANTIKYLKVTLASNFGNFYSVAIASLFINELPMLPLQILLLNLLTDFPMITVAADTVEAEDLRKPSRYDARGIVLTCTILGIVSSVFDFLTFAVFKNFSAATLQTMWFVESALSEIVLIYSIRTSLPFWRGARPPLSVALLTATAVVAAIVLPFTSFGQHFFHFLRPEWRLEATVFAIVGIYLIATDTVKIGLVKAANGSRRSN